VAVQGIFGGGVRCITYIFVNVQGYTCRTREDFAGLTLRRASKHVLTFGNLGHLFNLTKADGPIPFIELAAVAFIKCLQLFTENIAWKG